ncbi:MAG: CDP-alcohol phosphatidyltransferase family protein [Lachnospiraceae bacterium]|nr:CDP-alcohol phosphatidyltransferase family protein [Lachnospiraceae bacterium]
MFIGEWNKSVILTYIGMGFAVLGMYLAFMGRVPQAFACLIVAGVCDLFDGAVARKCDRNMAQKLFGIQLDSLVDVLSFLALPISICMSMGMKQWYHILVLIWFSICGIARLAFFNVESNAESENGEGPIRYYRGLPVTYTALILPFVYLLHLLMPETLFLMLYGLVVAGIGGLNILDVKVVKPRGMAYGVFALLAITMVVVFLLLPV